MNTQTLSTVEASRILGRTRQTITVLPRMTFAPPNRIHSVNDQVEAHAAIMQARDNTQIMQGFLNEMTRSMHAEFTKLHNEIAGLKLQIDRMESAE